MKILCTIAHYFKPKADATYGSQGRDSADQRLFALRQCIASLRQLYGPAQAALRIRDRQAIVANEAFADTVDVVVCTTGGDHLMDQLGLPAQDLWHHRTQAQPMQLGYECHDVLRDALGKYDFYCFLEDDLVLHDPMFFVKLQWFNRFGNDQNLLQANRYEVSAMAPVAKVYIDGPNAAKATAAFQNIQEQPVLDASVMGAALRFERAINPHSGCFFLNQAQMQAWASKPFFMDRADSFIGPLESAASLGIMRTFRLYKAAARNAAFLEIQHMGTAYLGLVGREMRISPALATRMQGSAATEMPAQTTGADADAAESAGPNS